MATFHFPLLTPLGRTPLDVAVELDQWKVVAALLEAHLDCILESGGFVPPNLRPSFNHTLRQACKVGEESIAKYFLEHKQFIDWSYSTLSGWNPLHVALKNGRVRVARLLLEGNVIRDVNSTMAEGAIQLHRSSNAVTGFTALHLVAELEIDDLEKRGILALLLTHGANPNATTLTGFVSL